MQIEMITLQKKNKNKFESSKSIQTIFFNKYREHFLKRHVPFEQVYFFGKKNT